MRPEINPTPTPEEAAAIVAALETLGGGRAETEQSAPSVTGRSRWEIAGRLGRPLPAEMSLEGALWPLFDTANRGRSL